MPTSTCEGGLVGVPSALRTKPSTIRMRVKPVTIRSAPGSSASSVIETRISTGVESALPLIEMPDAGGGEQRERGHARAVRLRRFSRRLLRRSGVGGRKRERHVAAGALDEHGLVGGVHPQRRDRVLGGAHEDQLVAGAHEVQRAVGGKRRRGDDADALVGAARLGAGGALEQPVHAVDHAEDDREADDRADDVRAGAADRPGRLPSRSRPTSTPAPSGVLSWWNGGRRASWHGAPPPRPSRRGRVCVAADAVTGWSSPTVGRPCAARQMLVRTGGSRRESKAITSSDAARPGLSACAGAAGRFHRKGRRGYYKTGRRSAARTCRYGRGASPGP